MSIKYALLCCNFSEIMYTSGDTVRYYGLVVNGIPNGEGTMTWKSGEFFKGK
jgi:hypothetical protein